MRTHTHTHTHTTHTHTQHTHTHNTHTHTHIELYRLGRCDLAGEHFGYAKVSDLQNIPLPVEHDILRLQVTVQDVQFVDMVNGHQKLDKEEKNVL